MCGIAGIISHKPIDEAPLQRMSRALAHRGPNDCGVWLTQPQAPGPIVVGLANTRLAILDLSQAGHQPMEDPATGNWVTFNGEIYNFRELREELSVRGRGLGVSHQPSVVGHPSPVANESWHSHTDTEVILKGYARWGKECLDHLRGMFAFALWDSDRQELFLVRDPFGIKPLYYYQTDEVFLFASEVRALLASGMVPRKLSPEGLVSYLQYGSVQDPLTIIDGVRSLLPGHCLVVKLKGSILQVESSRYASDTFTQEKDQRPRDRREAVEILRTKLEESVRLHLVSDVPVGVFLSGGIDSSAIVALMSQVASEKPKTFSVVFAEREFSEASYSRLVAEKFGTDHREISLSGAQLLAMLPDALGAMDQPTMDVINTYVISKAVKEAGVTVALSGLGGDELFAGYPSFRRAMQLSRLARSPHGLRKIASIAGRALSNGSVRRRKFWDMVESDCSPHAAYAISRQLFAPADIDALTGRAWRQEHSAKSHEHGAQTRERNAQSRDQNFEIRNPHFEIDVSPNTSHPEPFALSALPKTYIINQVSALELTGYMASTLLRDTDQMSMTHTLEVRVPFVDSMVVPYVLGLPGKWKVGKDRPKPLLVDAMEGLLPEEIWRRPKMGFTLPFGRWMHSALKPGVDETLAHGNGLSHMGVNPEFVRVVWQTFKRSPRKERWSRPWALYVLKKWCDHNNVWL